MSEDIGKNGKTYYGRAASVPGYSPHPWTYPPGIGAPQVRTSRPTSVPGYTPRPWTFPPGMGQVFHAAGRPQSWAPSSWTFRPGMGAPAAAAAAATPTQISPPTTNGTHQAAWVLLFAALVLGRRQAR